MPLAFLPERRELQHLLRLLQHLPGPGLRAVTQPAAPPVSVPAPGTQAPRPPCLTPPASRAAESLGTCRGGGWPGVWGAEGHPEWEGDEATPE